MKYFLNSILSQMENQAVRVVYNMPVTLIIINPLCLLLQFCLSSLSFVEKMMAKRVWICFSICFQFSLSFLSILITMSFFNLLFIFANLSCLNFAQASLSVHDTSRNFINSWFKTDLAYGISSQNFFFVFNRFMLLVQKLVSRGSFSRISAYCLVNFSTYWIN